MLYLLKGLALNTASIDYFKDQHFFNLYICLNY